MVDTIGTYKNTPNDYITQGLAKVLKGTGFSSTEQDAYKQAQKIGSLLQFTPIGIPQAAYDAGDTLGIGAKTGSATTLATGAAMAAMAGIPAERGVVKAAAPEMENLFRGEYSGNKGGNFYSPDKEFAREFTQSGQDNEIINTTIPKSHIYDPQEPVFAGHPEAVDEALLRAKAGGYKALRLSEGVNQPMSVFVFDKTSLKPFGDK